MAILEKIRSNAGLMVGFVGLALAAFVLGDALQSGNSWFSANQRVVLSVDGEEINIEDYERRLQVISEQMQQQSGGQLSDEQRMTANNALAQQITAEHILGKLASEVGISVTADEVYALLTGNGVTPAPQAQQFFAAFGVDIKDSKAVAELIKQLSDESIQAMPAEQQQGMRSIQAQWNSLQESLQTSRLQQKIHTLLARSYKVTKLDQELAQGDGARTVALVRSTPMAGTDKADTPSDEAIKKYYDSHPDFFRSQEPSVDMSYVAVQVTPSSEDYKAAEKTASEAFAELQAATSENVGDVVRNHNGQYREVFFTGSELDQLGLGAGEVEFLKTATPGAAHNSGLVSDKYNLVKLVAKKSATESLGLRMIVLDSLMSAKADSLVTAIKGGANFEELVGKYSQDPTSKANGGRLSQQGQYGIPMDSFSEAQLAGSPFADAYQKAVGEPFVIDNGGIKIIVQSVDAKPAVEKYQFALVNVDASFSEKTYNGKYDALNRILGAGGKFADMMAKAEKEGFTVVKSTTVSTSVPTLGYIPSSRSLVSWALRAEEGDITDKVYRVGNDYLIIASANKHYAAGQMPLSQVREQIVARLSAEKRAENLVSKLSQKPLASLEAYATELNVTVDTLVGVDYMVRGSEAAAFNGKAMTTPLGKLSAPFVAGVEVMVLQPVAKDAAAPAAGLEAQAKQNEQATAYQIASRVFGNAVQRAKIEDNRARFY
ncbi:MAG: peptidylprolyl isomerase [Porphyromonas sp.]|nr:peptidylprolyl isomerase [Porphyromonas sp.]